ncbi:MAG: phosphatase PAP2 family protein [Thermomicrobiales bacterium]
MSQPYEKPMDLISDLLIKPESTEDAIPTPGESVRAHRAAREPVAANRWALDRTLALALHSRHGKNWTRAMRRATDLASGPVTVPIAIGMMAWKGQTKGRRSAEVVGVAWIGAQLVHGSLKLLYHRKRPTLFPPLVKAGGYALPSGHTVTAVVTYGLAAAMIGPHVPARWRRVPAVAAGAVVAAVGTSRVYLGVHYPSDVLAGIFVGGSWLWASLAVLGRVEKHPWWRR